MDLQLKIESQTGYVRMTYQGQFESRLTGEITSQMIEVCEKHQPSKLLMDCREVSGPLSLMDRFNLAAGFSIKYSKARFTGTIPPCQFAFVANDRLVDPNRFGETVAVNRGINIKVFIDMAQALAWLGVKADEASPHSPGKIEST